LTSSSEHWKTDGNHYPKTPLSKRPSSFSNTFELLRDLSAKRRPLPLLNRFPPRRAAEEKEEVGEGERKKES